MKHIVCNYCGQDNTQVVNHGADLLLNLPGDFYLVRCLGCGLIYQNPQLSAAELAVHYPDNYLPYQLNNQNKTSWLRRLGQKHALSRLCARVIRHRPNPGYLLDVGCATGVFLNAMRERGWQVKGVEPGVFAANYARQQFQLDIFTGLLEEAAFPSASFDVVTLWDVLEHVADPKATLQEIGRILKPNGLLIASVPNPNSVEAWLFGSYWVGWERPRHLHLISPALAVNYLAETGFQLENIESFNGRLSLTLLSLEFWLKSKGWQESYWRPFLKLAYTPPFRLLTWPVYRFGEWQNKTSIMTLFARRIGELA